MENIRYMAPGNVIQLDLLQFTSKKIVFSEYYLNSEFSDVTIETKDGDFLPAHKIVLNQVPFFNSWFSFARKDEKPVKVNVSTNYTKQVLKFLYGDTLEEKLKRNPYTSAFFEWGFDWGFQDIQNVRNKVFFFYSFAQGKHDNDGTKLEHYPTFNEMVKQVLNDFPDPNDFTLILKRESQHIDSVEDKFISNCATLDV